MPTDTTPNAVPTAPVNFGTPVEITAIARELKKLWQADQTRTRASLINFAIICEGEDAMRDSTELLERFVRNHSFHALLIGINPHAAETSVQAWINANCYLPKAGGKHVCCEQITLSVQGKVRELLPNLLFSQLDYDLPLTLWWRCECPEQVDAEIWRWVDRLIFDSGSWKCPRTQFAAVRAALAENRSAHGLAARTVLGDLNWVRSRNLRLTIAQMYDMPDGTARLRKMRSLAISHGRGYRTTALLFLGWFASLLGWSNGHAPARIEAATCVADRITFTTPDGGKVACELSESSGAPLHRVVLEHDDVSITVDHPAHSKYLNLTLVWKDGRLTRHLVPADSTDLADLLDAELARGSRHGIYIRALAAAEPLL